MVSLVEQLSISSAKFGSALSTGIEGSEFDGWGSSRWLGDSGIVSACSGVSLFSVMLKIQVIADQKMMYVIFNNAG